MKDKISNFKRKIVQVPLIKNILIMGGGAGIAQLLPIISAPIVSRLYLPEDFGTYALFYSLSTILYGFATLDYHNVIVISDTHQKAFKGIILSISIAFAICCTVFIFSCFLPKSLLISLFGKQIQCFILIIPLTAFFNVLNTVLYNWFLRHGQYKFLSKNKIILASCSVILQISIGLLKLGTFGFIIANLSATFIAISLLFIKFNKEHISFYSHSFYRGIDKIAREYKKFPLVSVWGNALNVITLQIPEILLNKIFGSFVLGQYSLAQRMINLPTSFIASSVQEVFRQSAAQENRETGNCKLAYMRTLKITSVLAALLFIASLTILPPLFVWVFGEKWIDAGTYVRVLSMFFAIRFIAPPLSYVFYVKNKQQIDFYWQIGLFILSLSILFGGYYWLNITNPLYLLLLYSCTMFIWYFINIILTYNLVINKK
ncbi:MAG: oligosaccharide flippase family protein [Chitinophagaceae bacterium]